MIRLTGSAMPVRVRRGAEFARAFGAFAVRASGGPDAVRAAGGRAGHEGVPLWMARRVAPGPGGLVVVAVDRRLVRADVWTDGAPGVPALRLRGPYGLQTAHLRVPRPPLTVTVGEEAADLTLRASGRRSRRFVTVRSRHGAWELWRQNAVTSRLERGGRAVAFLTRPGPRELRGAALLPLASVDHRSGDPLDAAVAHFFAVVCGLGDATGGIRFGARKPLPELDEAVWDLPWPTGLGTSSADSGPGAVGDAWG
uniref:hypothetical protein n=1 Tax=Streptomyces sp. SBT349 TaxID=1580539 RepID=UPI000A94C968